MPQKYAGLKNQINILAQGLNSRDSILIVNPGRRSKVKKIHILNYDRSKAKFSVRISTKIFLKNVYKINLILDNFCFFLDSRLT